MQRSKRFARGCKGTGKGKKPTLPLQRKKRPAPTSDEAGETSSRSESEESDEGKRQPKKRKIGDEVLTDEVTGYEENSDFVTKK